MLISGGGDECICVLQGLVMMRILFVCCRVWW